MKKYLKLIFMFMAFICLFNSYALAKKLSLAPDFTLKDINQDTVNLSTYKDKQTVLLFFWTTWCPFCRKELRDLNQMHPELKKDGLEVLAIDVGESLDKVRIFIKSYALSFKVLLDKDTAVAQTYSILGVPTYVLVDKKGSIVFQDHYFPRKEYKGLVAE